MLPSSQPSYSQPAVAQSMFLSAPSTGAFANIGRVIAGATPTTAVKRSIAEVDDSDDTDLQPGISPQLQSSSRHPVYNPAFVSQVSRSERQYPAMVPQFPSVTQGVGIVKQEEMAPAAMTNVTPYKGQETISHEFNSLDNLHREIERLQRECNTIPRESQISCMEHLANLYLEKSRLLSGALVSPRDCNTWQAHYNNEYSEAIMTVAYYYGILGSQFKRTHLSGGASILVSLDNLTREIEPKRQQLAGQFTEVLFHIRQARRKLNLPESGSSTQTSSHFFQSHQVAATNSDVTSARVSNTF